MNFLVSEKSPDEGIRIYLKTLSDLISDYENSKFKSGSVSGKEILAYLMDLQGLTQSDLAKEVGRQPIVCKILKGESELNLRLSNHPFLSRSIRSKRSSDSLT